MLMSICAIVLQYYRNNQNLPLRGMKNPDVGEIFRICLFGEIPARNRVRKAFENQTYLYFCCKARSY